MKKRFGLFVALITVLALSTAHTVVHASVNDFTIENFVADYTLGQADPQGTLMIREELTVNFTDYNHGITRALPTRYNSMAQHPVVNSVTRDGVAEDFTTSKSNDNLVLKIGNANKTITGLHHYVLNYRVDNVIRFENGHAQLDWNVNGTQWQQPFVRITARLHVPSAFQDKLTNERCFTGALRSTASDCTVSSANGSRTFVTTRQLNAGETLTFNETIPAGYFTKPGLMDKFADYGLQLLALIALPFIAIVVAGRSWFRNGRDAKGRGTIVPEYGPPSGLHPAEIDVLLHNKVTKNAVSATIIDLAIRKFIRIHEGMSDGVLGLGKHKTYSFELLTPPVNDGLKQYEATILSGMFGGSPQVSVAELKDKFYTTVSSVELQIPESLAANKLFARNPATASRGLMIVGGALLFIGFFTIAVGWGVFVGFMLAGIIFLVFGALMPKRTEQGAAAKDAAEGLKLYLNTAEKDRLSALQSPDGASTQFEQSTQSVEPAKTVQLFEKLLPYAMVLGVEDQWAKRFTDIYTTPPNWYTGNWSTFNSLYLAHSLNESMGAMNSSFAAPSSSSSGFSGGSGGGGGGGGGGGW